MKPAVKLACYLGGLALYAAWKGFMTGGVGVTQFAVQQMMANVQKQNNAIMAAYDKEHPEESSQKNSTDSEVVQPANASLSPPTEIPSLGTLRLGYTVTELRTRFDLTGIPNFLRHAGVIAITDKSDLTIITWQLNQANHQIGIYKATFTRIDDDRTRVDIDFIPTDENAVKQIAAKIETNLTPNDLFLVTMRENFASQIEDWGRSFNLSVLRNPVANPDMVVNAAFIAKPRNDNFELNDAEKFDASIRKLYSQHAISVNGL